MSAKAGGAALDFQRVYDEFQPRIRRYLARLAGAAEAEDLTQDVGDHQEVQNSGQGTREPGSRRLR